MMIISCKIARYFFTGGVMSEVALAATMHQRRTTLLKKHNKRLGKQNASSTILYMLLATPVDTAPTVECYP